MADAEVIVMGFTSICKTLALLEIHVIFDVLLGESFLVFWRFMLPSSCLWWWRHYDPLECQERLTPWHGVTSQRTL